MYDPYPVAILGGLAVDGLEVKGDHAHEREPDQKDITRLPHSAFILSLQELERGLQIRDLVGQELDYRNNNCIVK